MPQVTYSEEKPTPVAAVNWYDAISQGTAIGEASTLFSDIKPVFSNERVTIYSFPNKNDENMTYDISVFEKTVTLRQIVHKSGVSKNGKTWHTWKPERSTIFSLKKEKHGVSWLRVYSAIPRRKNRKASFHDVSRLGTHLAPNYRYELKGVTASALSSKMTFDKLEGKTAAEIFALWILYAKFCELNPEIDLGNVPLAHLVSVMAYPALRLFNQSELEHIPTALTQNSRIWLVEPDVRVFIRNAFGKEAVRKDIIKAVSTTDNAYALATCSVLNKMVPVDWLLPLLREPEKFALTKKPQSWFDTSHLSALTSLLKRASETQRKRLVNFEASKQDNNHYLVVDAYRMLPQIPNYVLDEEWSTINFNSWKTIHDSLAIILRDVRQKPLPVPQEGLTGVLDGLTYVFEEKTYTIVSPKNTKELHNWGTEMSNCIASYGSVVANKRTSVFAVYTQEGKMFANMEIRKHEVYQFMQKYNEPVERQHTLLVQQLINKKFFELTPKQQRLGAY